MKLLFAPNWVIRAIEAAQLPRSVLLNAPKLLSILSAEDVKVYCQINAKVNTFLPHALCGSFHHTCLFDKIPDEDREKQIEIEQLERSITGGLKKSVKDDLEKYILKSVVLDESTLLVYQTDVVGETDWLPFYEGILMTLNNFYPLEDFVREPITIEFLKLAKKGMAA